MGRPRKVQPEPQQFPGVSSSPRWLIIVTDDAGPRLFSAHCKEDAAKTMRDSLDGLTAATVTMIEVPNAEGIMKSEPREKPAHAVMMAPAAVVSISAQPAPVETPAPAPAAPSRPAYRTKTPEQLEMETARALARGGSQIISDAILDDDEPIS
jgi:hypothetical protein